MSGVFLVNGITVGPLLVVWLVFLAGAASINQYSGRLINGSKGFLILLAVLLLIDMSILLIGPGFSAYLLGQLMGTYLFTGALPLLVAWWFSRKRGSIGIDPVTGLMATAGLTRVLKVLLCGQALLSLGAVVAFAMEYRLAAQLLERNYTSPADMLLLSMDSDQRLRIIEVLGVVLFIASAVLMLKWIYRSNYNARQLGAQDMQFSPGWSVGWFFVPVLQLWKPFQVVKELFQASKAPHAWKTVDAGAFLPFWWALFVLDKLVGSAVPFFLDIAQTPATTQFNDIVLGGFQVTEVVFAVTTLVLVTRIHGDQSLHSVQHRANLVAPAG